MNVPINSFKQAMQAGRLCTGLWVGLADAGVAEALANTGYDWLLIDGEHAPNDVRSVMRQLQAVAPYPVHPIVRPVQGDVALIKQLLDIGAQTLLVPMVETAGQAAQWVAATRYPPRGVRGVGAALARASRWNAIPDYLHEADAQMCLLVQVETVRGLENLEAIARTEGVDGVFFGPADLSASMGLLGQGDHEQVRQAIMAGIRQVVQAGKAPGVLATDLDVASAYAEAGALFVGIGVDAILLTRSASDLLQRFRQRTTR